MSPDISESAMQNLVASNAAELPGPLPNEKLPALFWDTLPETATEHADYAGLQALAEESTPEERAENFKVQGNNKLRVGLKAQNKVVMREAMDHYSSGLALRCANTKLNAVLLANRSHIHSLLGNWRRALEDAEEAVALDPANVKACFRGARAALQLDEFDQAVALVEKGLQADPEAKELSAIATDAKAKKEEAAARQRRIEASREAEAAPARQLTDAILQRGYQVTRPQVSLGERYKPRLDEHGVLHWPLLLMYPEAQTQDAVEDVCENDLLSDHLDVMFGPDAPPLSWDTEQAYTRERIEVHFLSNAGTALNKEQLQLAMQGKWPGDDFEEAGLKRFGKAAPKWTRIDERLSLKEALRTPGWVIPGIPLLFVVAKGTDYRQKFLAKAGAA